MKIELFPFQKIAVENLRLKADYALKGYAETHVPQVVSLQAPTGSGKTVMMTAFIESVLFGDERHDERADAVFVWLSDSPTLNAQSKEKIDLQSDKIRYGQTVVVDDASFDRETFEDGRIYFLNTQKLSKAGNLGRASDARAYTIWQTIRNTVREKSDRLFFIIDEAHRGMQGSEGGRQTAIMQRFLKGWPEMGLPAMPVVIGMSATPERFNRLVEQLPSTIARELVPTEDVRASGLLKDRIIITYPEDPAKQDAMAVLAAATKEWLDKCEHWRFYCTNQHYRNVDPVFVVQVRAGSEANPVSETDLEAAVAKIADVAGRTFAEGEIVHTFGSVGTLTLNGLAVPHVEPSAITADRRIRIVLFKENLSTGWDCPRAETMMSFRRAEDDTYVAQLLGRMIRTPLQCHVEVDPSLNDVRLFLPYFDATTVERVVGDLRSSECGEIPSFVGGDVLGSGAYEPWGVKTRIRKRIDDPHQMKLFTDLPAVPETEERGDFDFREVHPQQAPSVPPIAVVGGADGGLIEAALPREGRSDGRAASMMPPQIEQPTLQLEIDRQDIIRRINQMGILRHEVRTRAQRIHDYLTALLSLAGLLTRTQICPSANATVRGDLVDIIRRAVAEIRASGRYGDLARAIREMTLKSQTFDAFGEMVREARQTEFEFVSDADLERQLREADAVFGRAGIVYDYGRTQAEAEGDGWMIDCIVVAGDAVCRERIAAYAKEKFHALDDENRRYVAVMNERVRGEYDEIVASGDIVSEHSFVLPESIPGMGAADGMLYGNHLYADENGFVRLNLNSWEAGVIAEEERRDDFVCFLRNPPRQKWSLAIAYRKQNEDHAFYPDFLVVRRDLASPTGYVLDILEPHADEFDDNLAKAQGLARYAQKEIHFGRIEMIRRETGVGGGNVFRRLDINKGAIREKVLAATTNDELRHIFSAFGEGVCNRNFDIIGA